MHIHSYQIHNVLNVYRRQLSRGTAGTPERNKASQDPIQLCDHGQRQSLFEKISSEIVQRIAQVGPETEINAAFSGQSAVTRARARDKAEASGGQNQVFSYTLIDSNNQKTTHNFSVRQLNHSTERINPLTTAPSEGKSLAGSE